MSSSCDAPTNLRRRNFYAAQWRVMQKRRNANDPPITMRSARKRVLSTDLVEGRFQQKMDEVKQNLSERMVSLELEKTSFNESMNERLNLMSMGTEKMNELSALSALLAKRLMKLEDRHEELSSRKEKSVSVDDLQQVMSIVADRLSKLEDGHEKMADKVADRFSQIEETVDEKITVCLDDYATTVEEKVTMCYEECASLYAQQSQAVRSSLEKILVAKLEEVMEMVEYNLMVRFSDVKPGFDEYQRSPKFGQTQRKKHKPK